MEFLFLVAIVQRIRVPIDADFPITEKLEFKPFNKYDILDEGNCMIDDSILWYFSRYDNHNIGFCYDLRTGEKLSTIAMKGDFL